jgi:phosphatidylinositol-4,5-bisphosphate 3-kinase
MAMSVAAPVPQASSSKSTFKGFSSFWKKPSSSTQLPISPQDVDRKVEKTKLSTGSPPLKSSESPNFARYSQVNVVPPPVVLSPNFMPRKSLNAKINNNRISQNSPAKRAASTFPVQCITPAGDRLMLNCSPGTTPTKLAQIISSKVPELQGISTSAIMFMYTERATGVPVPPALSPSSPLSLVPPIKQQVENATIPLLTVVLSSSKKSGSAEEFCDDSAYEEFAGKTFSFELQLPGGQALQLQCKGNDSIAAVKTQIVPLSLIAHGIELLSQMDIYMLTIPGVDSDGESSNNTSICESNSTISFIEACRNKSTIPKLVLMEKPSAFTRKEKEANLLIGSLVGKPLCWAVEELETTTFRQKLTREQYLQKKSNGTGVSGLHVDPDAVKPRKNILIHIFLPLNEVVKGVAVEDNETADQLTARVFQKHYAKKPTLTGKTAADFILKVTGVADYIYGNYLLYQFNYVRKHLETGSKIELVLVEQQTGELLNNKSSISEEFSAKEFLEIADGDIRYSHDEIQSSVHSWDHLSCISIWEMKREFKFRIIGVENAKREDGHLFITAGLFHGGELQAEMGATSLVDAGPSPRWYETINTNMPMYNIPRATRVCFTLYEKKDGVDTALAWVSCMLFDYKHELKTGVHTLGMWPDAAANPIGTCFSNPASSIVLFVEFESYPLPVVFPTEPYTKGEYFPPVSAIAKNLTSMEYIEKILLKDPLYPLSHSDKELLWMYREHYRNNPKGLPKFLASVPYDEMLAVQEMHKYLKLWAPLVPIDALELLDARYADKKVREHAVSFLEQLSDDEFLHCLLQLTQVLKYEPYHDCALSRFLLHRALKNPLIGHSFFWYLKSEMHVPYISERYGLLLEVYLRGCGGHMAELQKQDQVLKHLVRAANLIKGLRDVERKESMITELDKIKFPPKFQLPLNPKMEASGVILNKCKYMDSKKLPLYLVFSNADTHGNPIYVIFKSGDDLRQDMLTLQMMRLMEGLWQNAGLDLRMSCYGCIATGDGVGMIEVVLNAETTAHIHIQAGGASAALFKSDPLANWIRSHNPKDEDYRTAVDNFMRSCAGYCVATYVLGIGDRHNDNVMITKSGKLFHIDFGHFLGNYKKKFGIKRERAPFVFTHDFAYVMGGKDTLDFQAFVGLCCDAYNVLRNHANMFINLFAMMLSTGIPELQSVDDIAYLRDAFVLDLTEEQAREHFKMLIYESLDTKTTLFNNAIHILARTWQLPTLPSRKNSP